MKYSPCYCILGDKICKLIFLLQHSNFFNISICKTIGTAYSDGLNGEEASEGKDHLFEFGLEEWVSCYHSPALGWEGKAISSKRKETSSPNSLIHQGCEGGRKQLTNYNPNWW